MRKRWLAALLVASLTAAVPVDARQAAPAISIPVEPFSWRTRAGLVMDHESLAVALREHGFGVPGGAEIYAAEIVPGVGQPAMMMFDAGEGAFSLTFWPASSVKLLATVAALGYVDRFRFSGEAGISASWMGNGTIRSVYEPAIVHSDNQAYDRLVRLAGVDFINLDFAPAQGLDSVRIGSSFSGLGVTVSPAFTLSEWIEVDDVDIPPWVPAPDGPVLNERTVETRNASRAYGDNDADLFDLAEAVRRVMLAGDIPAEQRFPMTPGDLEAVVAALCVAEPAHFRAGARRAFGDDAEVCGKSGWWERTPEKKKGEKEEAPPPACTDVALITDPDTGRRVLLAGTGGCGGGELGALAEPAIQALSGLWGTPLQMDAGLPMEIELAAGDGVVEVSIETEAAGALVWIDDGDPVVASRHDGHLEARAPMPGDGPHLLVVIGVDFGVKTAYRAVDFEVSGNS
ncbi:MAG: class A beta-lactamase-related serine hydrolase [Actinobacteria bacterium]|nr:class A beta-lactamase-related serine hydrolase [Actinomycetota bacterium]